MKENQAQEDLKDNEYKELLYDEIFEKDAKKINKEINLNIYNYREKKLENYKILNEDDELLLCKEEIINEIKSKKENKEEDIKLVNYLQVKKMIQFIILIKKN